MFEIENGEEALPDSYGNTEVVQRFFEPRYTIVGAAVTPAARNTARLEGSVSIEGRT